MKRVRPIRGFTLLEILTAMAIVALMIGLLIPAIGTIQHTAQTVKQKAQFRAIEIALEAFRTDWGDYPPSSYTCNGIPFPVASGTDGYCGAQKLAEAIVGWDGFGFHPKSQWRSDGRADFDGDGTMERIYDVVNGIKSGDTGPGLQSAAENLKARKGPYLELEKANAVKLSSLYVDPSSSGIFGAVAYDTFVLCDMFGLVKNLTTGKKAGMPILYFRADTTQSYWRPNPLRDWPWNTGTAAGPGTTWDSIYLVNENYPFLISDPPWGNILHPMSNRGVFYDRIKNPNYPGTAVKNFRDARPYRAQTFILLSAGPDGLYGTSDDVYNIDENEK